MGTSRISLAAVTVVAYGVMTAAVLCLGTENSHAALVKTNAQLFVDRLNSPNSADLISVTAFDGDAISSRSDQIGVLVGPNGLITNNSSFWRGLAKSAIVVGSGLEGALKGAATGAVAGAVITAPVPPAGAKIGAVLGGLIGGGAATLRSAGEQLKANKPGPKKKPVQDITVLASAKVVTEDEQEIEFYSAMLRDAIEQQGDTVAINNTSVKFTETFAFRGEVVDFDLTFLDDVDFFGGIMWEDAIEDGLIILGTSSRPGSDRGIDISDMMRIDVTPYLPPEIISKVNRVDVVTGFITTKDVSEPSTIVLLLSAVASFILYVVCLNGAGYVKHVSSCSRTSVSFSQLSIPRTVVFLTLSHTDRRGERPFRSACVRLARSRVRLTERALRLR